MSNISNASEAPSTRKEKILGMVWWGIALGIVAGCALNSTLSGFDWVHFYYPRARNFAPDVIVNPLWVYLVISPIALLPIVEAFVLFSIVNVGMIWLTGRLGGVNRFVLLLSFPALWIIWYGQIDAFVALGAALGWWAVQRRRPALVGVALMLLSVKPHIGAPLALLYFLWSRNWRVLATAGLIFGATLLIWPIEWPMTWFKSLQQVVSPSAGVPHTADQQTNISLYPYGLLAWLVLLLPMSRLERAISVLAATFLSIPYAPTYSLLALLALPVPWWVYVISSVPLATGPAGYWITVFAPLGCLVWIVARRVPVFRRARVFNLRPCRLSHDIDA